MARTMRKHKESLLERGAWSDFARYRSSLVYGGMDGKAANYEAVKKFLGDEAAEEAAEVHSKSRKGKSRTVTDDGETKVEPNLDGDVISSVPPPPLPVNSKAFDGKKTVSEITNITWVADNMRVVNVTPEECPSLRAWNLLCECRENAFFRANFWKDHYSKMIPAKNTLDDGRDSAKIDGTPTMELIDRIRAMKEKAEA